MNLSIITINWNNGDALQKTMQSVYDQSYHDYEYVVIDGKSTDNSVGIIKDYALKFEDKLNWVSEKDAGIYNAMNKGILRSKGKYLFFLNSGDVFYSPTVLEDIFKVECDDDFVIGKVNIVDNGKIILESVGPSRDLSLFSLYMTGIPHQASFIKRELFKETPYDENLKINSDWKFFLQKLILEDASLKIVNYIIANYDNSGLSSVNKELLLKERQMVFKELVPKRISSDYNALFPHYYEITRMNWLLKHKWAYRIYRAFVSMGMRITHK